jgi:spoIIIJ-associated protein
VAEAPRTEAGGPSNKQKLLDSEGDAAADYLEELLDIADLDGDIDIFVENGRASVAVLADESDPTGLQALVGEDGEVLDALQELTRLAAQAKTGERSRLLLDIAGFRENRRTTAAAIAAEAVSRVRASGESVELEPMPAYQRKAVHDAVAEAGLRSESDGAEPRRFVVVHPS